jgi:DNA-binding CsgD family transcriptional regulator
LDLVIRNAIVTLGAVFTPLRAPVHAGMAIRVGALGTSSAPSRNAHRVDLPVASGIMRLDELQRFANEIIDASRCLSGAQAFRSWALGRLRNFAAYDTAIYVPLSHPAGGPAVVNRNRAEYQRYYGLFLERPAHYLPGLDKGRVAAEAGGGAYVDTEVYTSRERDELPFFADIVRPQGISSQIVVAIDFHRRSRASIHLCRHGRVRAFAKDDAKLLSRVAPALALAQAAFDVAGVLESAPSTVLDRLSDRELTIATLVARGFSNRDIAALLGTSPNTVRNQLHGVFRKVQVRSRAQLGSLVGYRQR